MPFEKGTSGNPTGRPSHNVTAAKLRELITADDVQGILTSVIEQAKAGDIQAAKLILDKVLPSLKAMEVKADIETHVPKTLDEFYEMNGQTNPRDMTDEELDRVIKEHREHDDQRERIEKAKALRGNTKAMQS